MDVIITPHKLNGAVTPPPSKSQAHRMLIAAELAGGAGQVEHVADSQDIQATKRCMAALKEDASGLPRLDCGESGSTLRFLIPVALALRGGGVFTGRGRLMERPQEPYFELFRARGIRYALEGGALTVEGRLTPGAYSLRGDVSSQFITGLLYALPLLPGDSTIGLTTPLESRGYVDLTLEALARFGVKIRYDGISRFDVPGGQIYTPCRCTVEADWSQAGFYYAANGLGSSVKILGMNAASVQGDKIICPYYARLCAPGHVELDVSQCPDLVPALAVHAALRTGDTTRIVNAGRLRIKESDRLDTVTTELSRLGADITQGPDFLSIRGVSGLRGGEVDSHNDHRIAMMLAMAATRADGPVTLRDAGSVHKSYPDFWADYRALGGVFEVINQ